MMHHRVYSTETWYWPHGRKPGISPNLEKITKDCRVCGASFVTESRVKFRCDLCQQKANQRAQEKSNEKVKLKRKMKRAGLL